ncbi:pyridoxal phosphate-dependent transferase [Biscogniauxia marginata]|nr:pyridoxal phosphate-dependent transferase [Biscogniauxia marginata]
METNSPVERSHINLQGGWPTPRLHPTDDMQAAAAKLFASPDIHERLRYGPSLGAESLRSNIAEWLTEAYHPRAGPIPSDRIGITNGASNGLATVLQKFTDPGVTKYIWMVEPTYFLACPVFRDAGFAERIRAIPDDDRGINFEYFQQSLEEAEKTHTNPIPPLKTPQNGYPKIYRHVLYMVPTFSNPSGRTMALKDREKLVRIARKYDILIATDDVYDLLRWENSGNKEAQNDRIPIPPRIVDVDRLIEGSNPFGNVVSNGSFSKIVAPGVRVGWLEATSQFINAMGRVGVTYSGGNQAHLASLIINEMLASGYIRRNIEKLLIPTYHRRYHTMVGAIRKFLYPLGVKIAADNEYVRSGDSYQNTAGGFFLYIIFPDDGSLPFAKEIAQVALEEYNLKIAPGNIFTVTDDTVEYPLRSNVYLRGARLCWAWHEEETLVEGIARLADILRKLREDRHQKSSSR